MLYENIIEKIRSHGGRISSVRDAIIRQLLAHDCLVSYNQLVDHLSKSNLTPDRSTIFRELRFLVTHNIICKHSIADSDYFEIPRDHHHHLICLGCDTITKIHMKNHITCASDHIARANRFVITRHAIEFYGLCIRCRVA